MEQSSSFIPKYTFIQTDLLWYVGGIITGWLLKKLDYHVNRRKK